MRNELTSSLIYRSSISINIYIYMVWYGMFRHLTPWVVRKSLMDTVCCNHFLRAQICLCMPLTRVSNISKSANLLIKITTESIRKSVDNVHLHILTIPVNHINVSTPCFACKSFMCTTAIRLLCNNPEQGSLSHSRACTGSKHHVFANALSLHAYTQNLTTVAMNKKKMPKIKWKCVGWTSPCRLVRYKRARKWQPNSGERWNWNKWENIKLTLNPIDLLLNH